MKIQILILALFLLANFLNADNEVINGLRNQLAQGSALMPGDYQTVITNLQGTALADIAYFTNQEYPSQIKRFNFPVEIERRFNQIVYSYSIAFETFQTTIVHNQFEHSEFIGIGRNANGVITIGFIKAQVIGQSTKPPLPDCYQATGIFKVLCPQIRSQMEIQNALKPEEIFKIDQSLKAYACQLANQKLDNPPTSFEEYTKQQQEYEKSLLFMKYLGKECNKVTANCPYTQDENCLFFHCNNLPSMFRPQMCQQIIDGKKQSCQNYLTQNGNNDCLKCICINYKVNHQQNVIECL